jgi:hypothetical protein
MLSGCLEELRQEPDKNATGFGRPTTSDEIWAAITRPFDNVDLTRIQVGEKNFYEVNQQIQNGPPQVIGYEENQVIQRSPSADGKQIVFVVRRTSYAYENGVLRPSVSEQNFTVQTGSAVTPQSLSGLLALAPATVETKQAKTEFFNLSVAVESMTANFESCRSCPLEVHTIKFDYVVTRPGEAPYKQIHKLRISGQLPAFDFPLGDHPFYSGVLDYCVSALEPYQGSQVFVSACNVLRDFRR